LGRTLLLPIVFLVAGVVSVFTATIAAGVVETRSRQEVRSALALQGLDWVGVEADGLVLRLSGMAETEALRFRALSVAGSVVDSTRVVDEMDVRPVAELRPPDFSVELLRNDDGVSLIGLIPASEDREVVVGRLAALAGQGGVSDMLESAEYAVPRGWDEALDFGLNAAAMLPRAKVSIKPNRVTITAITASAAEKSRLESELARRAPAGLRLVLDLSAPRPVITPFTLRFLIDESGARFDACSADTEAARTRILAAAVAAGVEGKADCTIGLGVPSQRWAEAVAAGIAALQELGAGSLTFSDADVSLVAADSVAQPAFDRAVGELERALPDVFSLTAVLTEKPDNSNQGPPEFTAVMNAEGRVEMRGRMTSEAVRDVVTSFATARFGTANVYDATRLDEALPEGWAVRVLTALEAMTELSEGSVSVVPNLLRISGTTGNPRANAEIARLLASKLGEGARFEIAVAYDARLDPAAGLPSPEECVAGVNRILAARKIAFAPGASEIEGEAVETMDLIAEALRTCSEVRMEIAAHSDSQGREEMNLRLSQSRADAVLNGLMARRVLTGNLTAVGYGESQPIADNATEAGREANRRIEFTLAGTGEDDEDTSAEAQAGDGAVDEAGDAEEASE
jgi:OmpA-OmpF porin, OOP family